MRAPFPELQMPPLPPPLPSPPLMHPSSTFDRLKDRLAHTTDPCLVAREGPPLPIDSAETDSGTANEHVTQIRGGNVIPPTSL